MRSGDAREVDAAVESAWASAEPAMPAPTMTASYEDSWTVFEGI